MKFGEIPLEDALDAILAHAMPLPGLMLKKGRKLGCGDLAALRERGVRKIIAARLEPGDVAENQAADELARHLAGDNILMDAPFTGRCNLRAAKAGVLLIDAARVAAVNAIDEAVTVATLSPMQAVLAGELVGTVKIIPFAVSRALLDQARAGRPPSGGASCLALAPYKPLRVAVISTISPNIKPATIAKTLRVLAARLEPAGARIVQEARIAHDSAILARALIEAEQAADLTIVFGASAIVDRRDAIPAAVEVSGGRIERFGMPVDPGNLLLLARGAQGKPIIGAPGCARSPAQNGFDFVLQRLLAGIEIQPDDIKAMGVGGLLKEIFSRPQPRGDAPHQPKENDSD